MKNARVVFIVFGIALLMFVITPYASAQSVTGWFQGRGSMRGYEVSGTGAIVGTAGGSSNIYVNIADDTLNNQYLVTTCIEDDDVKGVWHLWVPSVIPKSSIYGDPKTAMIWDFADASGLNFYQNILTLPMFYVRVNKLGANFNSFSCELWDDSNLPNFRLGSCTITFKSIDPAKVPTSCFPASPFHGTFNGSWSGTCAPTYPVSGAFSVNIDAIGKVTGSYSGDDSGSILGTVDILGNLIAKGTAGGFSWVGQLTLSNSSLSGAGSWSGKGVGYTCNGGWSGSGTVSP